MPRPSWDQYFIEITHLVATRSTCMRRHVGALLVKTAISWQQDTTARHPVSATVRRPVVCVNG